MTDRTNPLADFNPWLAIDALKGVSEALVWQLTEGPASEQPLPRSVHASLLGLAWQASRLANDLNEFTHFVAKPVRRAELLSVLERLSSAAA